MSCSICSRAAAAHPAARSIKQRRPFATRRPRWRSTATATESSTCSDTAPDGLAVRVQRLRDTGLDLASARTRLAAHQLPPASQLEADWPEMDVQARREILMKAIDCVFVLPGKRNYDERIWVCPLGTEPRGLPYRGQRTSRPRSYRRARENSISERTLKRAKRPAGVVQRAEPR
jgi:hypothetical protein